MCLCEGDVWASLGGVVIVVVWGVFLCVGVCESDVWAALYGVVMVVMWVYFYV